MSAEGEAPTEDLPSQAQIIDILATKTKAAKEEKETLTVRETSLAWAHVISLKACRRSTPGRLFDFNCQPSQPSYKRPRENKMLT